MSEMSPAFTKARDEFLATPPEAEPELANDAPARVYGVVVDIGFDLLFTVAAFSNGATITISANGVGVNGLGSMIEMRALGRGIIRAAGENLDAFEPTDSPPLPAFGRVRFTALTYAGKRTLEVDGSQLLRNELPMSTAFRAVLAIMEEARNQMLASRPGRNTPAGAPPD